jgi:outer membrane protein assembly factor BamD (BamD/ComL family)
MSSSSSKRALKRLAVAAALVAACGVASAQEALRPDVGRPLQAAQQMIKAGQYREALAKVREADAVGGKNANESYTIERMRIAAASGAGDMDTAAKSFEAIAASGRASAADKARMAESIAGGFYRNKDYRRAMDWGNRYFREGGSNPAIRTLLIQSQYLAGDFSGAAKELITEIQGAEKAGQTPAQDRLNLLFNAGAQMKDANTTVFALERLVMYYPKKEYWVDLLSRMQRKPTFSDRLALDAYRLSLATGSMTAAADFMEMRPSSTRASRRARSAPATRPSATRGCATW